VLALIGATPRVEHAQRLHGLAQPVVVVANHGSYLDTVLMTALIPWPACFVAHSELGQQRWARRFYERIGAVFVERFDVAESVRDAERVAQLLGSGTSLIVFPEGRLAVIPELLPFRMGGFLAATRAGATVLPVALIGARDFMKGDRRLLRRVPLRIHVGEPIAAPPGVVDPWDAARALSERARSVIAAALADAAVER
jgi:1-acyl-sn-glycerol-3-phosphate acyltransferase